MTGWVLLAFLLIIIWPTGRDSTDGEKRSGMHIYTDHGTGVQYVGTIFGSITPRLKADGTLFTTADEKALGKN